MNASTSSSQKNLSPRSFAVQHANKLPIGGITPFTSIDYPGHLAAVLYTPGCAWRCRYCHNSHLWALSEEAIIPMSRVFSFLENRKGLLDGVVFCGGEPTAHEGLADAMSQVKEMGFKVALHTTGMYPERFREALEFCDWVGMDIKAPFALYEKVTQKENSGAGAKESVGILLESGVEHEFRTTVHPALLSENEIMEMARELNALGVKNYVLQAFKSTNCLDEELRSVPVPEKFVSDALNQSLSGLFSHFQIRY